MNRNAGPLPDRRLDRPAVHAGPRSFVDGGRRRVSLAWPFSVAAHLLVIAAILWFHTGDLRTAAVPSLILADVVELPEPEAEAAPEPPGPPGATQIQSESVTPPELTAPQPVPTPKPAPASSAPPLEIAAPTPNTSDLLSESQLAGAASVGDDGSAGGGGGGGCDMGRILQRALQRDPKVLRAVQNAGRAGKAVMLWDGAWVRSGEQDGKGLSGVREAIMWDIAFAPDACRSMPVRGLVLISLADGTRFAIGADEWRWSDLLGLRGGQEGPAR